jgi:hypothetical protein
MGSPPFENREGWGSLGCARRKVGQPPLIDQVDSAEERRNLSILEAGFTGIFGAREIPLAGVDMQFVAALLRRNSDRTVPAVRFEVSRFIGNQVAAADHLLKVGETPIETDQ